MRLSERLIVAYPRFALYVEEELPAFAEMDDIIDTIHGLAGSTTRAEIIDALQWRQGPQISIIKRLVCAGGPAYGCYTWGSNQIMINETTVSEYEAGRGLVKVSKGRQVDMIGVTLLHELTHWADAQDGVDDPVPGDPSNEEGEAFERAIYGRILG